MNRSDQFIASIFQALDTCLFETTLIEIVVDYAMPNMFFKQEGSILAVDYYQLQPTYSFPIDIDLIEFNSFGTNKLYFIDRSKQFGYYKIKTGSKVILFDHIVAQGRDIIKTKEIINYLDKVYFISQDQLYQVDIKTDLVKPTGLKFNDKAHVNFYQDKILVSSFQEITVYDINTFELISSKEVTDPGNFFYSILLSVVDRDRIYHIVSEGKAKQIKVYDANTLDQLDIVFDGITDPSNIIPYQNLLIIPDLYSYDRETGQLYNIFKVVDLTTNRVVRTIGTVFNKFLDDYGIVGNELYHKQDQYGDIIFLDLITGDQRFL